ncbi:hypothetical protein E2C01_067852 [Portunus trituberculatus]|uniref:Uncharacterized protein n=1 Tax=Portunus trituberculatus TaxID=210409 RepID=A0A5B7HUT3_PORTR|nr:hypothetical protein [Portunus trituberculatus]
MGEITTSMIPHWTYTHVQEQLLQTLFAQLRIGHTYLTQRYLLTRDPQPYCDDCLLPLTVLHLVVECPSLTDLRHRYLYRCRGRDSVSIIYKVLGPECLAQNHDVFRFLGEAGLLPKLLLSHYRFSPARHMLYGSCMALRGCFRRNDFHGLNSAASAAV